MGTNVVGARAQARERRAADPRAHRGTSASRLRDRAAHRRALAGCDRLPRASLYPTLYRMEDKNLIEGRWVEKAGQRRRRYYRITSVGRKALASQRSLWEGFFVALNRVARVKRRGSVSDSMDWAARIRAALATGGGAARRRRRRGARRARSRRLRRCARAGATPRRSREPRDDKTSSSGGSRRQAYRRKRDRVAQCRAPAGRPFILGRRASRTTCVTRCACNAGSSSLPHW